MNAPAPVKAAWRSAQLLIAFHKTRKQEKRDEPVMWRPKDATAFIPGDPEDREAFIDVKGTGHARDVQIKMHPDKLILRRDESEPGWTGIVADHHEVRVRVGDTWITVEFARHRTRCFDAPFPPIGSRCRFEPPPVTKR